MRRWSILLGLILGLAAPAGAAPTIELIWTGVSHGGAVGIGTDFLQLNEIDATARLLIVVHGDANGLSFTGVSLEWDGGDLLASNAVECPGPENTFPAFGCTQDGGASPPFFTNALEPGVTIDNVGGRTGQFTASSIPGASGAFDLFIGAIDFALTPFGFIETVSVYYQPGLDSVNDNQGNVFFPTASATIMYMPEPGTGLLLGLGLAGLGWARRRRAS